MYCQASWEKKKKYIYISLGSVINVPGVLVSKQRCSTGQVNHAAMLKQSGYPADRMSGS